jgi:hypothetical protein|tara:strand:- start:90 stop:617 length:528 start_codon:yes stop_codon:yes gene_type:complete
MKENTLFSILCWSHEMNNHVVRKEKIKKLLDKYPEKRNETYSFSSNRGLVDQEFISEFSKLILPELEEFCKYTEVNIKITDVWSVTYKKGDHHPVHNHGSLGLTGILYLDFPKGSSQTFYVQPWNNFVTDTTAYVPTSSSEGDMVITPKFLSHFSPPQKTNKPKRIISWDMDIVE